MSAQRLLRTFDDWRARGEPLVLGTVYDTLGSTYSKPGHRILISAQGDYQGLVSGGCLEGDLAERARTVVASGAPAAVTYDLRNEADELFGLGIGCNGLIRVFLQPLHAAGGYEPFAAIAQGLLGRRAAATATVIEGRSAEAPVGGTVLAYANEHRAFGISDAAAAGIAARAQLTMSSGEAHLEHGADGTILYAPLSPIPRVLVLGAGLDAIPLVDMAAHLGWRVTVADHRPAYLQRGGFERAERALLVAPAALREHLDLDEFDAIIVMSHHLATDRQYLAQLAAAHARYLGILGPAARRERLLGELAEQGLALHARLRGPVGLDIGADSPESIALSILAEMQATFAGKAAAAIKTS